MKSTGSNEGNVVELSDEELALVEGGNALILTASSNLGHLGRAFAFGYAIGSGLNWFASQGGESAEYYAP